MPSAELVFLPFAVALAKLAALAVEDGAGELVAAFAAVELDQDAPTVALVVDEPQEVERLHQSAELLERAGESGRAIVGLDDAGAGVVGGDIEVGDLIFGADFADAADEVKVCTILHDVSPWVVSLLTHFEEAAVRRGQAEKRTVHTVETVGAQRRFSA